MSRFKRRFNGGAGGTIIVSNSEDWDLKLPELWNMENSGDLGSVGADTYLTLASFFIHPLSLPFQPFFRRNDRVTTHLLVTLLPWIADHSSLGDKNLTATFWWHCHNSLVWIKWGKGCYRFTENKNLKYTLFSENYMYFSPVTPQALQTWPLTKSLETDLEKNVLKVNKISWKWTCRLFYTGKSKQTPRSLNFKSCSDIHQHTVIEKNLETF